MTPPNVNDCRFDSSVLGGWKTRSVKFSKLLNGKWLSGNGDTNSVIRRRATAWIWWLRWTWFFVVRLVGIIQAGCADAKGGNWMVIVPEVIFKSISLQCRRISFDRSIESFSKS